MKAFLMYPDRDLDLEAAVPDHADMLWDDLGLNVLCNAMAHDDTFLFQVAKHTLLTSAEDPTVIRYRQDILADCLQYPPVIRQVYGIAVEALDREKKMYWSVFGRSPSSNLHRSVELLQKLLPLLKQLRMIADENCDTFDSDGLTRLIHMLRHALDDDYLERVQDHLSRLRFKNGVLVSAQLGTANAGRNYVLRKRAPKRNGLKDWLLGSSPTAYVYQVAERDMSGAQALGELRARGINLVANALTQSTDQILGFFRDLRAELAFYIGCLNAHDEITTIGAPSCTPTPELPDGCELSAEGLYDIGLCLTTRRTPIGNDLNADGRPLIVITGANQGGKSTFLRSVGLAQLMMQAGMFVPAKSFRASTRTGVFTHYKRQEDATMNSGKLDEELARMSQMIDTLRPQSMILLNESFAATNEREGSEIARQIVQALLEEHVRIIFVTHQFDLADGFYRENPHSAVFLRADREPDGQRTFTLSKGKPLPTSFGRDIYQRVFGCELAELTNQ